MRNDKNLFVKLTKPQMLLFEKILREGAVVYGVAVIGFIILSSWFGLHPLVRIAHKFDSVFIAAFVLCLFTVFVPYVSVRWTIASYLTLRKQIMEEKTPGRDKGNK
jgi:hypothetical protein